ncbi:MAG: aminodeoxychorismate/anthranilate synthase component II [Methanomassiliicoccales archaeon]|nr:MAG: aminodeoxychorismate/anthranilate synthase component II [Methanomassiliicoccales archaeon]
MKVLMIDNYDSFVYNLKQAFEERGARCIVKRNDEIDAKGMARIGPDALVISPGPGHPMNKRDFGACGELIKDVSLSVPTLGVCLGHQGIAAVHGSRVVRARMPVHGKTSMIYHDGRGLFEGLESPMLVGRYHSLVVETRPDEMEVTARTAEGEIMAIEHRKRPIYGVQFHPESVLTPKGGDLISNFIKMAR